MSSHCMCDAMHHRTGSENGTGGKCNAAQTNAISIWMVSRHFIWLPGRLFMQLIFPNEQPNGSEIRMSRDFMLLVRKVNEVLYNNSIFCLKDDWLIVFMTLIRSVWHRHSRSSVFWALCLTQNDMRTLRMDLWFRFRFQSLSSHAIIAVFSLNH